MNTSTAEIAELVGGTLIGDATVRVTGVNSIRQAAAGDLTFISDSRYLPFLKSTKAAAILVTADVTSAPKPIIQVADPYAAIQIVHRLTPLRTLERPAGIDARAVIDPSAKLGDGVGIGPNVVIEADVEIGEGTVIHAGSFIGPEVRIGAECRILPNVTIRERVTIGCRCVIHPGVVIGTDGFGYAQQDGRRAKIPQLGTVEIGDDVEIGANTCIDRATFGKTYIGTGTKIDNLVQIGHNVEIGEHCIVCGNAGIAGSTVLNDNVIVGAGAGLNGHIEIGEGAMIGGYSGVTKSLKPGQVVFGYPAVDYDRSLRMHAALRQLPEALKRLSALERRILDDRPEE